MANTSGFRYLCVWDGAERVLLRLMGHLAWAVSGVPAPRESMLASLLTCLTPPQSFLKRLRVAWDLTHTLVGVF